MGLVALARRHCICCSVAQHPTSVLLVQFVGDAFVGQADELRERRVRPTGTARQGWDEAANRGPRMAIEGPQIDGLGRAAGRTAHPQEPMPCLERAPIVGENSVGMRLDCRSFHTAMAAGVFEDLGLGRALRGRFLFGRGGALCLHLAAVGPRACHGVGEAVLDAQGAMSNFEFRNALQNGPVITTVPE